MEFDSPTSDELATHPSICLVQGRWIKADVHKIYWHGRPLVVKSFARKSLPVRWIGRLQIAREERAFQAVIGIEGIPMLHGRPDAETLVIDFVPGVPLTDIPPRPRSNRRCIEQVVHLVQAIHARGVAHLDLRGRNNVLVDAEGTVRVIDFAAAWVAPEGSSRQRFLFPLLSSIDRSALLKWKQLLTPEDLTEGEVRKLRRYRRWRRLWPFNRKDLQPSRKRA